jgi:siroheme synthase (precorrin-2 oxidase/ferrochelatase)
MSKRKVLIVGGGSAARAVGFHRRKDEILDTPGDIILATNA